MANSMKKPLTIFLILLSCLIVFVFIIAPFTPKRHGRGCGGAELYTAHEGFKLPVSGEINIDIPDELGKTPWSNHSHPKSETIPDIGNLNTNTGNTSSCGAAANNFNIDEKLLNYLMTYNPSYQWQGPSAMDDYIMKTQIVPPVCPTCMQCANGVQGGGVCNNCGGQGGNGNSGTATPAATTAATTAATPAATTAATTATATPATATSTASPDVKDEHDHTIRGAAHTVGGDVRGAVKTIGGDVKQTVDTIGSTIGSFFNTLGSMAHNTVSTVGGDLNTVKNTIGSDINTVKNTIGSDINTVKNTIGRDIHGIVHTVGSDVHGTAHIIGEDIYNVVNTVGEELLDIPKGVGSLFDSDEDNRRYQYAPAPRQAPQPTAAQPAATQPAATQPAAPAPTFAATQPTSCAKTNGNTTQQPTMRTGIPSPSGVYFNGMDPKLFGNQPGALGGPKMDPYSYFGTVPSKGWVNEPQPLGADFSSFGR